MHGFSGPLGLDWGFGGQNMGMGGAILTPDEFFLGGGSYVCANYGIIIIFLAHQHKAAGMKIKLSKNSDHDGLSHGVKCSQEGDRIPPLKRYR